MADLPEFRLGRFSDILQPAEREALLRRAATHAISIIKKRTQQGRDVDGAAFKPYSKGYAKLKAGTGRSASPPNLMLTGQMLGSMQLLRASPDEAIIGFTGASAGVRIKRFRKKHRTFAGGEIVRGDVTTRKGRKGAVLTHTLARPWDASPVANSLKAASIDRGTGRQPRRHFFDLSPRERSLVIHEAARKLRLGK